MHHENFLLQISVFIALSTCEPLSHGGDVTSRDAPASLLSKSSAEDELVRDRPDFARTFLCSLSGLCKVNFAEQNLREDFRLGEDGAG